MRLLLPTAMIVAFISAAISSGLAATLSPAPPIGQMSPGLEIEDEDGNTYALMMIFDGDPLEDYRETSLIVSGPYPAPEHRDPKDPMPGWMRRLPNGDIELLRVDQEKHLFFRCLTRPRAKPPVGLFKVHGPLRDAIKHIACDR